MICASPWLQSWMLTQWIVGEHHLRLGAEEEICSSMSDLANCLPTNEKSSFYFTHFQVRLPIGSDNMSAAISMWFESIMHIPPTLQHDFKFGCWVGCPRLHHHGCDVSFYGKTKCARVHI